MILHISEEKIYCNYCVVYVGHINLMVKTSFGIAVCFINL